MQLPQGREVARHELDVPATARPGLQRVHHRALTQGPVGKVGVAQHELWPALARRAGQCLSDQPGEGLPALQAPHGQGLWHRFAVVVALGHGHAKTS